MSPREWLASRFLVNAWLVVKAFEMRGSDELDKIAISIRISCKKRQMEGGFPSGSGVAIAQRAGRHVGLAADDRPNSSLFRRLVKLDRTVEIAVIGNGHRRHAKFNGFSDKVFCPNRSVQQGVFRVAMQMNEGSRSH